MSSLDHLREPDFLYKDVGDYLKKYGQVIVAPMGSSMRPLLRSDACQVVLARPEQPPGKYDVVLYKSPRGAFILHRIVAVHVGSYDIRGDNTYCLERGIRREDILGVMEGFYRRERYFSVHNRGYRCYVRIWTWLYPLRRVVWVSYQHWKRRWKDE